MLGCSICGSVITDRHEPGCTHPLATGSYFTVPQTANFLAAKAVGYATAFLDGRSDAAQLGAEADQLMLDMLTVPLDVDAANLSDPARLLVITMMRMSRCEEPWRLERWQMIAASLVELVRRESKELRESGAQQP